MKPELELAAKFGSGCVESLDDSSSSSSLAPIAQETGPARVRKLLVKGLTEEGFSGEQVIEELHRDASPGLVNTGSGRFFGFVIGGALPATIAAEWLASSWDQNAGASFASPSSSVVEEVAGKWLKDVLLLPSESSFAFVPGCQAAHVTALAAARHSLLQQHGWNAEEQRMFGAPPMRVLVGEHQETLLRALQFLGFGTKSVEQVDKKNDGTVDLNNLEAELDKGPTALAIVAVAAGELNAGLFDPIGEVCRVAHDRGAWVHVNRAFGLWAGASPQFRHLAKGVEKADSWAADTHKWLSAPQACGFVVCRHPEAHMAAMSMHAPCAPKGPSDKEPVRDPCHWGPEWPRRPGGIAVCAALRSLGRQGVASLVEQCCDLAADLVHRLGELPGAQAMAKPIINQGLARFLDSNGHDHDARAGHAVDKIDESGQVWFGGTTWSGIRVMRMPACGHRTTSQDITAALAAVKRAVETSWKNSRQE